LLTVDVPAGPVHVRVYLCTPVPDGLSRS
jgi:hypothetical protein